MENRYINYPEELFEMASVRSMNTDAYYKRLIAVNPDIRHDGNPYFKYYKENSYGNKSGNQVARISFIKPEYILHGYEQSGIPTWKDPYPNSEDKRQLVDILNSFSNENYNYSVWTMLKYHWNSEKGFLGSVDDFVTGKMDSIYIKASNKGNYVPYSLAMPNYLNL